MKNSLNANILKKDFNFLTGNLDFKVKDIESHNYALYAKFISPIGIGIFFTYEFRDLVPQIQFTRLNGDDLKPRPGIYTIKELYKNENFILQSFFLDEILSFLGQREYRNYFQNSKSIEEAIKISAELVQTFAMNYVRGDAKSFLEIDKGFRSQLILV